MKKIIKIILKEESKKIHNMISYINNEGLFDFMEVTHLTITEVVSIMGIDFLVIDDLIKFIKDFTKKYGGREIEPILVEELDGEYKSVVYVTDNYVVISHYDSLSDYDREYSEYYHELDDDIIREIFDLVMGRYEDEKEQL
jgi:hypothetical protein